MRVTVNVLHREALYMLKDKGYKDTLSEWYGKSVIIWFKSTGVFKCTLLIEKIDCRFRYTLITPKTGSIQKSFAHNYLANLRLFIEGEL